MKNMKYQIEFVPVIVIACVFLGLPAGYCLVTDDRDSDTIVQEVVMEREKYQKAFKELEAKKETELKNKIQYQSETEERLQQIKTASDKKKTSRKSTPVSIAMKLQEGTKSISLRKILFVCLLCAMAVCIYWIYKISKKKL